LCYNDCGQVYVPGHKCPTEGEYKNQKEQKRIAKSFVIEEKDEYPTLLEFERDLDMFCAKVQIKQIPGSSSAFNYAPLLLNGKKYFAGIDSMATHSIISPDTVKDLNVTVVPQSGTITLADESVTRRIGTTVAISTKCKDIAISHCFEVMETGGTGVILGRDLFDK
jgi:hypothetical protein